MPLKRVYTKINVSWRTLLGGSSCITLLTTGSWQEIVELHYLVERDEGKGKEMKIKWGEKKKHWELQQDDKIQRQRIAQKLTIKSHKQQTEGENNAEGRGRNLEKQMYDSRRQLLHGKHMTMPRAQHWRARLPAVWNISAIQKFKVNRTFPLHEKEQNTTEQNLLKNTECHSCLWRRE